MLKTDFIDRKSYAAAVAMRLALFGIATIAVPLARDQIGATLGGDASYIFRLFFGLLGKTMLYVIFAVSLLSISTRRAASLGMTPLAGLALSLVVYADVGFGTTIANPVLDELKVNTDGIGFPWHLAAGAVVAATLIVLAEPVGATSAADRFGPAYLVWLGLLMTLAMQTLLALLRNILEGVSLALSKGLTLLLGWYFQSMPIAIAVAIALACASLWLIAIDRSWLTPPTGPGRSRSPAPAAMSRPARKTFGLRQP